MTVLPAPDGQVWDPIQQRQVLRAGTTIGTTIDPDLNTALVTVLNDDDQVTLDASAVSLVESTGSNRFLEFTLTRTGPAPYAKSVSWRLDGLVEEPGKASADDFAAITGSADFAAGELTTKVRVEVVGDNIYEPDETVTVSLIDRPGDGYVVVGNATAVGTIRNDDVRIWATFDSADQAEGNTWLVTVTREGNLAQDSEVDWVVEAATSGPAIDASDFEGSLPTGRLVFASRNDAATIETQTFSIRSSNDATVTGDRSFLLKLTNADGFNAQIKPPTVAGRLIDNDNLNLQVTRTNDGLEGTAAEPTVFTYTVTRPGDNSRALVVDWRLLGVSTEPSDSVVDVNDFAAGRLPSGQLNFAPGSSSATLTFDVKADELVEMNEAFTLQFQTPYGSQVASQASLDYIQGDEEGFGIALSTQALVEGNTDQTITIQFVRSSSANAASYSWDVVGKVVDAALATDASDFAGAISGALEFNAGQSTLTRTITLKGDSTEESLEAFSVRMLRNGVVESESEPVLVTNDDASLSITTSAAEFTEDNGQNSYQHIIYTVTRSGNLNQTSTAHWRVADMPGVNAADFVNGAVSVPDNVNPSIMVGAANLDALGDNGGRPSGSLTFAPGQQEIKFSLLVGRDKTYELDETIKLTLTSMSAGTAITTGINKEAVTLVRNDDVLMRLVESSRNQTVVEGNPSTGVTSNEFTPVTFTVERVGNLALASSLDWTVVRNDHTNTRGFITTGDFVFTPPPNVNNSWPHGSLNFAAGSTGTQSFTVNIRSDLWAEGAENFQVQLSSNQDVEGAGKIATVSVTDQDNEIRLIAGGNRIGEGQAGINTPYTWTFERLGPRASTTTDTYRWELLRGATNVDDFVAGQVTSGTLTFTPGDNQESITITAKGDNVVEPDEYFEIRIIPNSTEARPLSILERRDDFGVIGIHLVADESRVVLENPERFAKSTSSQSLNITTAKPDGAENEVVEHYFRVRRDDANRKGGDIVMNWRVYPVNGSSKPFYKNWFSQESQSTPTVADFLPGTSGVDEAGNPFLASGQVVIPDGQVDAYIVVKTVGDFSGDLAKQFTVKMLDNSPTGHSVYVDHWSRYDTSTGYIGDGDNAFSLSLDDPNAWDYRIGGRFVQTQTQFQVPDPQNPNFMTWVRLNTATGNREIHEGQETLYRVWRRGDVSFAASVDWEVEFMQSAVASGNTTTRYVADASDFDGPIRGTLEFAANEAFKDFRIKTKDDGLNESWAEAFRINLSSPRAPGGQPIAIFESANKLESVILDKQIASTVAVTNSQISNNGVEGTAGTAVSDTKITYTLTRTGDLSQKAQVAYRAFLDNSPVNLINGASTGLVTFNPGESEQTLVFDTPNNTLYGGAKTHAPHRLEIMDAREAMSAGRADFASYGWATNVPGGIKLFESSDVVPDSNGMLVDPTRKTGTVTIKEDDVTLIVGTILGREFDSGLQSIPISIGRFGNRDNNIVLNYEIRTAGARGDDFAPSGGLWNKVASPAGAGEVVGQGQFRVVKPDNVALTQEVFWDRNVFTNGNWETSTGKDSFAITRFEASRYSELWSRRIKGTFEAPVSGTYTFYLSSDTPSALYISTGRDRGGLISEPIARVTGSTASREWTKFESQKSISITLVEGESYYLETLQQTIGTNGHLAVGWSLPGSSTIDILGSNTGTQLYMLPMVQGDTHIEPDESFDVVITQAVPTPNVLFRKEINGSGTEAFSGTGTIISDDVEWSVTGQTSTQAIEGNANNINVTFTISRGVGYQGHANVRWAITPATPQDDINAADFTHALTGTVAVPAGHGSATVTVTIKGDFLAEKDENFRFSVTGADFGIASPTNPARDFKIINNDSNVRVDAVNFVETDSGVSNMAFTVTRLGTQVGSTNVTATVQDDTTDVADFGPTARNPQVFTFNAVTGAPTYSEVTQIFNVPIVGDVAVEPDERFKVQLSGFNLDVVRGTDGLGNIVDTPTVFGTIGNNDASYRITAGPAAIEGDPLGQTFTITRGASTSVNQTINWQVVSATGPYAVLANDFVGNQLPSGSVTFSPGELEKTLTVISNQDATAELSESFKVVISAGANSAGVQIAGAQANGRILNDDAGVPSIPADTTLRLSSEANVLESSQGGVKLVVTRTGNLSYTADVMWRVETTSGEGIHASLDDFDGVLPTGKLTMEADQTSVDLLVPIFNDGLLEGSETFRVVLFGADPGLQIDGNASTALVTILDDEARLDISSAATASSPTPVTEGNGTNNGQYSFVITRSVFTDKVSTVDWSISALDPNNGTNDFIGSTTGTVSFAAGETTKTVNVQVRPDAVWEAKEPFRVELSRPSAGTVLGTDVMTYFDVVNDDPDQFTLTAPQLPEGDPVGDGDEYTVFAISASRINSLDTGSFEWVVAQSTNAAFNLEGIHPDSRRGTVEFAVGELTKTFNVLVRKDNLGDIDRNFDIVASNPLSADGLIPRFTQDRVTVTVVNDDPVVGVHVNTQLYPQGVVAVNEGAVNQGMMVQYEIRRSGDVTQAATVEWEVQANAQSLAPVNAADFGGFWPSGTVAFLPGEISKPIQFRFSGDANFESNEGFQVYLSNLNTPDGGARITTDTAYGVILNDDNGVRVFPMVATVPEGNLGTNTPVIFSLNVMGVPNQPITVHYVIEGSAPMGADAADFVSGMGPGMVNLFTDRWGNASQQVGAVIRGDNIFGANELVQLRITSVSNASIAQGSATVTIVNDDSLVSMQAESQRIHEGQRAGGVDVSSPVFITVTREGDLSRPAVVDYRVTEWGDNSVHSSDFIAGVLPAGQIQFAAGAGTATVTLNLRGDADFEGDETFLVRLSTPTNVPIGSSPVSINPEKASTVVTVLNDDDSPLNLSVIYPSILEGNNAQNSSSFSFDASRMGDLARDLTVSYTIQRLDASSLTLDGWSSTFKDGLTGNFIIPAMSSSAQFNIDLNSNLIAEPDRNFKVIISAVGHQNAEVSATVIDDDSGISISRSSPQSTLEGSNIQHSTISFVVTRAGNLGPAKVNWALSSVGLNGVNSADFVAGQDLLGNQSGYPSGEIAFANGETAKTIQIRVAADAVIENTETFKINLIGVILPSLESPQQKILISEAQASILDDDLPSDERADVVQGGSGVDLLNGGGGHDMIQGGAGADRIFGGDGNDTIFGGGGADLIYGGSGNDLIILDSAGIDSLSENHEAGISGGSGVDTIKLDTVNQIFHLQDILGDDVNLTHGYARISGIERIDLTGLGDNTLVLGVEDAMAISEKNLFVENDRFQLLILGNSGDKVDLIDGSGTESWSQSQSMTRDSVVYQVWSHVSDPVTLYIQAGIMVY